MRPSRRYRYGLLLVAACAWLGLAPCELARCDEYQQLPVDQEVLRGNRGLVFGIISTGAQPLAGNEQEFDRYFVRAVFPLMTQKKNPEGLAKLRRNFLTQFMVRAAARPAVYTRLRDLVIQEIPKLIRGNFHPAVRYNATLILADMDRRPGRAIPPVRDPVPEPQAFAVLMDLYKDEAIPDAVKVGCLLGMQRHARYGDAEDVAAAVTEPMRKLAGQVQPPEGRDPNAHTWMRRMALDVLATLGQPGEKNENAAIFLATLKDETAPTKLRCAAAQGLDKFKYADDAPPEVRAMTFALGQLAIEVLQQEAASNPATRRASERRQRLVHRLKCVQAGLQASSKIKIASDGDKQLVTQIEKPLGELLTKLEKDKEASAMGSINLDAIIQEVAGTLEQDAKAKPAEGIEEAKVSDRDGEGRNGFEEL